jgi:hypothetical protein
VAAYPEVEPETVLIAEIAAMINAFDCSTRGAIGL